MCQSLEGREVYQWPEFQAFAKRLGIAVELSVVDLAIVIPCQGTVRVLHDFYPMDMTLPSVQDLIKERTDDRRSGDPPGTDPQAGAEGPAGGGRDVLPSAVGG